MSDRRETFRKVNRILDAQPRIAFIPADQLIPWLAIFGLSYYVGRGLFGLTWIWTGTAAAWGISSWWILTAQGSWRFLGKFVPLPDWARGRALYRSMLNREKKNDSA